MWRLARQFRAAGGRTALLTNNVPSLLQRVRVRRPLGSYFDVVTASCELGFCKPDPRIFRACLEALDVPAVDSLFVDDQVDNVAAAAGLGMRTFLFDGADAGERLGRLVFADRQP